MDLDLTSFLIVCPLVFLAGFVDAIAGGGGLISLPAYILAGVPMHGAVATNKLSSAIGTFFSTARYCKNKYYKLKLVIPSIVLAFAGSIVGANLVLQVSDKILKYLLIALLPIIAFYVLKKKKDHSEEGKIDSKKQMAIVVIASFIIGCYDGFYGPGTGTFLLLVFTGLAKMDIRTASGNVKLVNLTSNISALIVFIMNGQIVWLLGFVAAIFSIAGHYIGSGMVISNGTKIVKPIMIIVIVLLFIKVVSGL